MTDAAPTTAEQDRWAGAARRWAGPPGLELGVMVPISEGAAFGGTPRFADMLAIARAAEEVGFGAVWFADHFVFRFEEDTEPRGVWDCWTTMAGIAAATERIRIGALVACTGFRNPGVIAKMAESIDDISGGRFLLGLGAGWHRPEYDMFGFPFDHRVSRFEESTIVIDGLLRDGAADFEGRFVTARGAVNRPRGPRPDGPPILVGTTGHRMLRLTARYADAWNTVWHPDADAAREALAAVDDACREVGRPPETLIRTAGGNIARDGATGTRPNPMTGDDAEIARRIAGFRDLGFRHFVCGLDPCTPDSVRAFRPVVASVAVG
jgi:probable F420-dependent oxidoreductase